MLTTKMIQTHNIWKLVLFIALLYETFDTIHAQEDDAALQAEPAVVHYPSKVKIVTHREINCEHFSDYASKCAINAALMYNSNKKSPPMPSKIYDWCKAIKYLTSCAMEWNMDCRDVTDSHFNEESLNGHSYVVHNICDDKAFIERYMDLEKCVEGTSNEWEVCYTNFKNVVDGFKKNTSSDWTHYETHFHLCCGRARFRRCVLDLTFDKRNKACTHHQAITLQKFSVIVSEGDVYQDCDFNMIYGNCPGGDPRPPFNSLGLEDVGVLRASTEPTTTAAYTYEGLSDTSKLPEPLGFWSLFLILIMIINVIW